MKTLYFFVLQEWFIYIYLVISSDFNYLKLNKILDILLSYYMDVWLHRER